MPEDKPQSDQSPAQPTEGASSISPAPTEAAGETANDGGTTTPAPDPSATPAPAGPAPDALSDGTMPTVLTADSSNKSKREIKGRSSLNNVYRKADILTTLFTFVGAIVVALLILGGYWYFTEFNKKPVVAPKVTTLDKAELEKLNTYFGSNNTGNSAEVLTVSSAALFRGRVAIANDLKVTGAVGVTGTTTLSDLVVEKSATLATTGIRGNFNVSGTSVLQGPALMNGGASISGNLTVSGNGSFGGSLSAGVISVRDLTVSGIFNLSGHIAVTGLNPSVAPSVEAGSGATTSIDGNDASGTVIVNTGTVTPTVLSNGGLLAVVTFRTPYSKTPRIIITPIGSNSGRLTFYVLKTANGFTIGANSNALSNTSYAFDYWIVQ